jgi:hypothetical protein
MIETTATSKRVFRCLRATKSMRVAEQAQKSYEHFIEAWRPRPPKGQARERLNPARKE